MAVGTRVGLPDDLGIVTDAVIVEDRGDLGIHGEQIVRLQYRVEGVDEDFETETSVLRLVEPPTESVGEQLGRLYRRLEAERRRARRAATA
jgi:hypothetical protein